MQHTDYVGDRIDIQERLTVGYMFVPEMSMEIICTTAIAYNNIKVKFISFIHKYLYDCDSLQQYKIYYNW